MNKNNKKIYFNQTIYENLHSLCLKNEDVDTIRQNTNCNDNITISYQERIESMFENGLNINNYIFDKEIYTTPITMIEDLTIAANNATALSLVYQNIDSVFFKQLPYNEKKSIAYYLMSKTFFSDGEKEYLLSQLYDKGFLLEQEKEKSLELTWLEDGQLEGFRILFLVQKSFDFDFKYSYNSGEYDFTSIIENKILDLKNKNPDMFTAEIGINGKIKQLEYILDCAHQLIFHQTLSQIVENNIPDNNLTIDTDTNDYKI